MGKRMKYNNPVLKSLNRIEQNVTLGTFDNTFLALMIFILWDWE